MGAKKLEAIWVCSDCLSSGEKANLGIGTVFGSEKISKGTKIFALISAWLLILFVLYSKWSNIAPEQFYLYFLYPFFAAYVIAGAWYQGWYLVTFKNTVGRPKFFATIFLQILFAVLTVMAADYGYERGKLFCLIGLFSFIHVAIVVTLYKKAKNNTATA